jgi:hypothetical protein
MARTIQAWAAYGPKITLGSPMTKDEIIENIVAATPKAMAQYWLFWQSKQV